MESKSVSWSTDYEKGIRQAPRFTGVALLAVSFQTLGIIYSDIGKAYLLWND